MTINRGYVPCHKISGPKQEKQMSTIYTVECPNCKKTMELKGDYSENLETPVKCSSCAFTASGYNFNYVKSTIEGEGTDGGQ